MGVDLKDKPVLLRGYFAFPRFLLMAVEPSRPTSFIQDIHCELERFKVTS